MGLFQYCLPAAAATLWVNWLLWVGLAAYNSTLPGAVSFFFSFFAFCLLFFFLIFIRVELIYNVVLVSAVQQSESVIHITISTLFRFFPHIGHYRVLSRVPCAIQ